MDPSSSVSVIENDLRALIALVLGSDGSQDYLLRALGADRQAELVRRRVEEAARRAPAETPESLLAYTHLYELKMILNEFWKEFAPALGKRADFMPLLERAEDFRNAPAHSRELLPYERDLLSGIAGEIRTRVTRFRSTMDQSGDYYPIIESVSDSHGITIESVAGESLQACDTHLRLEVGHALRFSCRAWDPQGRAITWKLQRGVVSRGGDITAEGDEVVLETVITEKDVGETLFIGFTISSSGDFHRGPGTDDDCVFFRYAVNPPRPS